VGLSNLQLTPQLVQAVRDAVDIVDIAAEHTRLRKTGRRHVGLCPLHREKTPSFSVDPVQGLFYCFGCGSGGDAIKLYMLMSGDDFPAAIEALARRYGIPLPPPRARRGKHGGAEERDLEPVLEAAAEFFCRALQRWSEPRTYLQRRGIPPELVERYGIGYAPDGWRHLLEALHPRFPLEDLKAAGLIAESEKSGKPYDRFRHRLIFPIRAASGRLVGFGGRTLGDDRAKYINTHETPSFRKGLLLYGLDIAKRAVRERGAVLLVEGYFDVLGAVASGVDWTLASMGTALTPEQVRLLSRFASDVVVGYDGDEAGEQAFRRALPLLLGRGLTVRRAQFGANQDPDSLRLAAGPEAVQTVVEESQDAVLLELERLIPSDVHLDPRLQARAGREVAELLQSIQDSILRYSYSRKASDRIGIPVELLWRRVGAKQKGSAGPPDEAEQAPQIVRSLEEKALQLLLSADEELPPVEELPAPEVFLNPICRNIYRAFHDLYMDGSGHPPVVRQVLSAVPSEGEEVDQMARLLLEGSPTGRAGELKSALSQLDRRWKQQRLRGLANEISKAQRDGDRERLEKLLDEKTALSRSVHRAGEDRDSNEGD
jgi:DNA primase